MSRRPFLLGMLCGALLTAIVAFGSQPVLSWFAVRGPAPGAAPSVTGTLAPALPGAANIQPPTLAPPPPLPPGTYRFEFNGMPVYIMPLAPLASR